MHVLTRELSGEIQAELDRVMPYTRYEISALDMALMGEAVLEASARMNHVLEILEQERITSGLERNIRGDKLYAELYPDETAQADLPLFKSLRKGGLFQPTWHMLHDHGSVAARERADVRFLAKYGYTGTQAIEFCKDTKRTEAQATAYLSAAYEFTDTLFEIRFIGEDEQLKQPLIQLGVGIARALSIDCSIDKLWEEYLDSVIGNVDLLGEDGTVMEDTTAYLLDFATQWFAEKAQVFRPIPANPGQLSFDI
jgi:hypothetical protein